VDPGAVAEVTLGVCLAGFTAAGAALSVTRPQETLRRFRAARRALAAVSPASAVRWWLTDPDRPGNDPAMIAVRIGSRQGDDATTVTALDPIPPRGAVVLHAVLPRGADRPRLVGVLWAMSQFAHRKARGRWACYVTNGSIYGYVNADATRPIVESVQAPGSVIG
jgi:hypothetical protein